MGELIILPPGGKRVEGKKTLWIQKENFIMSAVEMIFNQPYFERDYCYGIILHLRVGAYIQLKPMVSEIAENTYLG